MDIIPALWELMAEWRDWVSQPNIDPLERRDIALKKFFNCITEDNSSLNLSGFALTSLSTLPGWEQN